MSYSISGDYITIELSAAPETKSGSDYKWVAAGFSEDEEMVSIIFRTLFL